MRPYRIERGDETPLGPLTKISDASGRLLGLEDLAVLADTPEPSMAHRYMEFILSDESTPKHGKLFLRPQHMRFSSQNDAMPSLTFLDTGLTIGTLDSLVIVPAGQIPHTEGHVALATVRFAGNALAALAWQAVCADVLNGVCLQGPDLPRLTGSSIMLCPLDGSSIVNARVLHFWTTHASADLQPQ